MLLIIKVFETYLFCIIRKLDIYLQKTQNLTRFNSPDSVVAIVAI